MPLYYTQPYRAPSNGGGVTDASISADPGTDNGGSQYGPQAPGGAQLDPSLGGGLSNQGLYTFNPVTGSTPSALGTGGTASLIGGNGGLGTNNSLRGYGAPMAPNFAGGSTDSNVFTSPDYIKNLNQNAYAGAATRGQLPSFTQDQFNNAWQNNMTQGAGNNYAAFNQALGAQDVVGPTGGIGQYGAQSTTTDPAMLAKMRLQNQINSGQTSLAQATQNAGGYVNPQSTAQPNPMTQAGGGTPGQAPAQNQQSNLLQMLQQLLGGGGQGSPAPGANGLSGYNSWGNPYGGNPFAFMTGQAGGPFSSMYGGGMGGYGGGFGGGFGNPMQGNYGQLGGVAQLLSAIQGLQSGFGGRAPSYQSMYQNPFSGFGF